MASQLATPSQAELATALGSASRLWSDLLCAIEAAHAPLSQVWKPSKSGFGRMCLLQRGKRTLLYLTPDRDCVWVAIVLGERACQLAQGSDLPDDIKQLLREARPYAEGRGIRFPVASTRAFPSVASLLALKTASR